LSLVVGRAVGVFNEIGESSRVAPVSANPSASTVWGQFRDVSKKVESASSSADHTSNNDSLGSGGDMTTTRQMVRKMTKTAVDPSTGESLTVTAQIGAERHQLGNDGNDDEWWVFGYGSLIWRPSEDVPHVHAEDGYIEGYVRRFWQQSPDHRGTEEFPGRVATILPLDEHSKLLSGEIESVKTEKVFGRVFKVDPKRIQETRDRLLFREKAGYEERTVEVVLKDGRRIRASVFMALPSNEHFVGPEPSRAIAERIYKSIGPSGKNTEYFEELVRALQSMRERWGPHEETVDPHLMDIWAELKQLRGEKE